MMAFLLLGAVELKTTLRTYWEKRNLIIEVVHTPREEDRWIYVQGDSTIDITYSSLIQSEGSKCAVIHRLMWRDVPRIGNMTINVVFRDQSNKILERIEKTIVLGPPPDPGEN
jgi:hypothetical protein